MDNVKYPNITVRLIGKDGNAFSILGIMLRALRTARIPEEEVDNFRADAMSGDYDHLLRTCMQWVNVE